jgi:hypothetical protein
MKDLLKVSLIPYLLLPTAALIAQLQRRPQRSYPEGDPVVAVADGPTSALLWRNLFAMLLVLNAQCTYR